MPSAATLGRSRPPEAVARARNVGLFKNIHNLGVWYVFLQVFWDAESIASIRIEIGATEAASEAVEAAKLATKHISKINVLSYVC